MAGGTEEAHPVSRRPQCARRSDDGERLPAVRLGDGEAEHQFSNTYYFGKPIYSYSLKQGIHDGFLAPYKVVKVHIDRDIEGYRPEPGKLDRDGKEVEDRIYNVKDFDRSRHLPEGDAEDLEDLCAPWSVHLQHHPD